MEWQRSPSGQVWRKRLYLCGEKEVGRVTSLVRYEPGAQFHRHEHPDGEEIFVLEGTFSDATGDYRAGTYLLHPQGFAHAPFSRAGCTLFVRLRQYAGVARHYVSTDTHAMPWQATSQPGIEHKTLYADSAYADETRLERWAPTSTVAQRCYAGGVEYFVLDGEFEDEQGHYPAGSWLRLPAGACHQPVSPHGCKLYVKLGLAAPPEETRKPRKGDGG